MEGRDQEKSYDPAIAESKWYRYWEELSLFRADPACRGDSYCIVIPPRTSPAPFTWGMHST